MEKEVNCTNSRAVLDYLKEHLEGGYSRLLSDLDPEIEATGDPEGFLSDPNNWISCTVASELYQRASVALNDPTVAYKIAKFAVEKKSYGYAQRIIVKAFGSVEKALKNLQKINDKWNRNKRVEVVEMGHNRAIVRLHWNPNMGVSKHLCLMNQGAYTFLPLIWGGDPLDLQEVCCQFAGSPYCEFLLTWTGKRKLSTVFRSFFFSKSVLVETIEEMESDKKLIESKYEEVNCLNRELERKIKQLEAIQETGKAILSVLDLDQLLAVIMNLLSSVCRISRAIVMLVNESTKRLEYLHGLGFDEAVHPLIKDYSVPLHRVSNLLVRVTNTGLAEYIPEVQTSPLRKGNILLTEGKPASVFVVPLITRSRVIGVIATDATDGNGVPEETRETLKIFAPQIAIAIENARLYRNLKEKMDDLKRSQALLSRAEKFSFLGNLAARIAHEIKNPLTAIGTFIQLLPSKYEDEEFRKEFYNIAVEETMRVNNLITELLDLVKTREANFTRGELQELISKMVLLVSPQSKAKNISVTCDFDEALGPVWMDSEKMKQIILNLLSNAVDFTPRGGKIEVKTRKESGEHKPDAFCIEIKDSGMGIPDSALDRIFEPYFTTKHRSSIHSGTGLGLFITYQLVQDHGGTIEVKSKINEGTIFSLTFPNTPVPSSEWKA
ncbi:MAG: GAF domain-containing protein [Deltaproteobacteria bacterium]|nr:GAF domain-containing protein [Deltaproteobacteria bacterium]